MRPYEALPSQKKFHVAPHQFRGVIGGLGSGKTRMGSRETIKWTQQFPGSLGVIGRLTSTALRDTTQRTFFNEIDHMTKGKPEKLIHKWSITQGHLWLKTPQPGVFSEILFRHLDDPGPLGSLDLDWFWIDECHEPEGGEVPEETFMMLRSRLRGVIGPLRGFLTSNCGGMDWIYKWFFNPETKPKEFWGITVPSLENIENLPPGYVENLMRDHPEAWVQRFIHCSFDVFEGQIFEEFEEDIYILKNHLDLPTLRPGVTYTREGGLDFGIKAPTCVLEAHVVSGANIVYIVDEFYKPEADIKVVADWIKTKKLRIVWSDPSVRNRGPNKKSPRDLYLSEGVVLSPAPSNDALVRISMIHRYLMRKKIFISPQCVNLITSLKQSRWAKVKEGNPERPEKKEDHARDALSYLLLGNPLGDDMDAIDPYKNTPHKSSKDGFRHPSLDQDKDKDLDQDVLSEEEWLSAYLA